MIESSIVWTLLLCLLLVDHCSSQCRDLDTRACELMLQQNSALCKDEALSYSACPRFCNLCPLTCYHCDAPVHTHTDCNFTKACQAGEQCMLRELTSSKDGHHEYQMNCANLDMCDGNWISSSGKRNVVTQCCSSDLCNNPGHHVNQMTGVTNPVTVTTAASTSATVRVTCNRDIEFLVEDSRDTAAPPYIKQFLRDIVGQIDIGQTANQVGVALFDNRGVNGKIDMKNQLSKSDLLQQIDNIGFNHRNDQYNVLDIISFLQNKLRDGRNGDRQGYRDVVVIIADHISSKNGRNVRYLFNGLTSTDYDVIVINVGSSSTSAAFSFLASGPSHIISVADFQSLASLVSQVLSLVCM